MRTRPIAPGTALWIRRQLWRTERALSDGRVVRFDVARGNERATFLAPFDRPTLGPRPCRPMRVRPQQGAARIAGAWATTYGIRTLAAARDARIDLLAYQLEPALAVLEGHRRILLADEVGLGKTIQSGLVIAELLRRRPYGRVLVIAPAGLCDQWAGELATRFSLTTHRGADALHASPEQDDPSEANPWRRPGIWLTSSDWIKQAHVLGGIPRSPWDLVVIDETHSVVGRSERHDACAELVRRARHALLLSATPHGGDVVRFERLLSLGALPGDEDLVTFRRTRADVGLTRERRIRWSRLRPAARMMALFDELTSFERSVLRRHRRDNREGALLLLAVFRRRAVSSVAALERSLTKRLAWLERGDLDIPLASQLSLDFGDGDDDLTGEDRGALYGNAVLDPPDERRHLEHLRRLASLARADDPKISRVRHLLARTDEPVVIFTEFRDSLDAVEAAVATVRRTAVLHGGQTERERSEALSRFLTGCATVLIATDVAGQGLNLQARARWVINLELPWNPARLEQRIGRVDRLGQPHGVHASLLVVEHRAEAALVESLTRRALSASQALGHDADSLLTVPPPAALAAAVFALAPLPQKEPASVLPRTAQRWRRAGRANVRAIERRRAWRRLWRSPGEARQRPASWSRGATPALAPGHGAAGYAVPILDCMGHEVERHVRVITDRGASERRPPGLTPPEAVLSRALAARVRRAGRWQATASVRLRANEDAIARHLLAAHVPRESQGGLFGKKPPRRPAQTAQSDVCDHDREARRDEAAGRSALRIGPPELLWIWDRT